MTGEGVVSQLAPALAKSHESAKMVCWNPRVKKAKPDKKIAKKRRQPSPQTNKFSWVILKADADPPEPLTGDAVSGADPREIKKLRGHAGYSWKPI